MRIKIIALLLLLSILHMGISFAAPASGEEPVPMDQWEVDDLVKFHYAYLEDACLFSGTGFEAKGKVDFETPGIPAYSKRGVPDITNIVLKGILDLGFPLPTRDNPETFTFFLKLYKYPKCLCPAVTADRIVIPYMVDRLKSGKKLMDYISKGENVLVKMGFIALMGENYSETKPCPAFRIPTKPVKVGMTVVSPQAAFDASIPFLSLYVKTKGEAPKGSGNDEKAAWSVRGLLSFHRELVEVYRKNCTEVQGMESDKYYYFLERQYNLRPEESPTEFVIIKIPKKPMVFANYKDLEMPMDPKTVRLSGLLLVYRTRYVSEYSDYIIYESMVVDDVNFHDNNCRKIEDQILEVGSVVVMDVEKK